MAMSMMDFRVTPGRIDPSIGGVKILFSLTRLKRNTNMKPIFVSDIVKYGLNFEHQICLQ